MLIRTPLQTIAELQTLLVGVGDAWSPGYDTASLVRQRQRLYGVKFSGEQYAALLAFTQELLLAFTHELHEHHTVLVDNAEARLRKLLADAEATIAVAKDLAEASGFGFTIETVVQLAEPPV